MTGHRDDRVSRVDYESVLAEFNKLKDEQAVRIQSRDSVLNYNVVGLGVIATVAASAKAPVAWLLVPWVSMVFGWQYLMHNEKVTAIGRYVRYVLRPAINHSVFGWEMSPKRVVTLTPVHRAGSLVFDLLAFSVPCILGPVSWVVSAQAHSAALVAVSTVEVGFGLFLAYMICLHSEFGRRRHFSADEWRAAVEVTNDDG